MLADPGTRLRRLRRRVLGHRRLLAAICAAVAMLAALRALSPPPVPPDPVVPLSLGARLATEHPDLTPLPVRLPDAGMAGLLEPGDRVSLLATATTAAGSDGGAGQPSQVVARDALVLAVPAPTDSGAALGGGSGGRLVVLGLHPDEASGVSAAAIRTVLTFSWGR